MMKKDRALSVDKEAEPAIVARHMGEAITYLIAVANGANLPRLATLLVRVRSELLLIEVSGEDLQNPHDPDPTAPPSNQITETVRRQRH